jgi:hypothetical protein
LLGEENRPGRGVYCSSAPLWDGVAGKSGSSPRAVFAKRSLFGRVSCARGVGLGRGFGTRGDCAPAAVLCPSASTAAGASSNASCSPKINARACFPRASTPARPFSAAALAEGTRSGYPRARLALVGDANDGLRGGLRGGSLRGLADLPDAPLVGDAENRRGGAFRGLVCLSSAARWEREDMEGLRGGCLSEVASLSPSGETVFLLFLAGSSMGP